MPNDPEHNHNQISGPTLYVESVGEVPVLFCQGIPLSSNSREFFYGSSEKGPSGFDFVDVAIGEIADKSNDDLKSLSVAYQEYRRNRPDVTLEQYIQKRKAHREQLLRDGYKTDRVSELLTTESETPEGKIVNSQFERIFLLLASIIRIDPETFTTSKRLEDAAALMLLIQSLRQQEDKPFLIVFGHGGADIGSTGSLTWSIGEQSGEQSTTLRNIFQRIQSKDPNKYSAVILVSCNEFGLQPPSFGSTLVVYVDGLAGFSVRKRSASVRK